MGLGDVHISQGTIRREVVTQILLVSPGMNDCWGGDDGDRHGKEWVGSARTANAHNIRLLLARIVTLVGSCGGDSPGIDHYRSTTSQRQIIDCDLKKEMNDRN